MTLPELLDQAPAGFLSFRDDGTIVHANATLADMLGHDATSLVGRHIDTILTVAGRIFHQTHFFPLVTLHGRADEIYLTLRTAGGEPVHVFTNAVRREVEGMGWRTDCVILRIHERQKYEQQLLLARSLAEEANRSKSRFLSAMSHDLRTPLNAVAGYADLLLLGIRGELNPSQREYVERMKSASGFLLGLLNDVLTFARLEVGHVHMQIEDIALGPVLTAAEKIIAPRLAQAGVQYARDPDIEAVRLQADAQRLQQILLNLLSNALKFTPRGGSVTVSARREGETVSLAVADTGRGIPADAIPGIFEPFVQVDASGDQAKGGVGLGLAICRELARAMAGDISVTSTVNQGTTFTVALPARAAATDPLPIATV